ncbi:hypothetical protein ALC57_05181 [Trachymyrmex cornetzi]|uniref:Uncharacterized protein n=1 Tax=Trachymyrmex cornetzi TaxID=471704 RepID=A0A151JBP5_9HYME|nr:hypothetical protein ALC57_05181 [Trachymyrmex cornetzi]
MTKTVRESVVITRETTGEAVRYVVWIIVIFPIAHPDIPIIIIVNETYVVSIKFMSRDVDLEFCQVEKTAEDKNYSFSSHRTLRIFLEFSINFLVQYFIIFNNLRKYGDEILYRDEIGNLLIYNVSSAASKILLDSSNPVSFLKFLHVV